MAKWSLMKAFPSPEALDTLRQWNVRYVLVASLNYGDDWPQVEKRIAARNDLRLVGIFQEKMLYRDDRWFISTRGTALPFVADRVFVYELLKRQAARTIIPPDEFGDDILQSPSCDWGALLV